MPSTRKRTITRAGRTDVRSGIRRQNFEGRSFPIETEDEVPAPLTRQELLRSVKPRNALRAPPDLAIEVPMLVAGLTRPRVSTKLVASRGIRAGNGGARGKAFALDIEVRGVALGQHVLPPPIPAIKMTPARELPNAHLLGHEAFLPDHLALRPFPQPLPRELQTSPRPRYRITPQQKLGRGVHLATTVFPPDDRYSFSDTAYPWCTVGRVDTPGGQGTGVMVGPRHLLTVSHAIQWNADNTAGWVKFTPSYFDGSAPFGVAWGTRVYYQKKVYGPTIDADEGRHDYVCVVLDRRMGNLTGWMGTRSWTDSWDDEPYWSHIGYPGDLTSGNRPTFQGSLGLDGSFWDPDYHTRIWHKGDVWPGQSGGPYFGWWSGEVGPRAVAVQSGQNPDENSASGGAHMVDLVIRARNEHP